MSTALTPAQKAASNKRNEIRTMLEKCSGKLDDVLRGTILTPEKMLVVAMTAVAKNPKLLECTPVSVALAVQMAAEAALPVDGYHAHLVPYGTTCQLIIDYKGLIRLAEESGVHIDPYVVHEKDFFEHELGLNPVLRHIPSDDDDPGPLCCAYAVITHADGFRRFVVMKRKEIMKRKAASKSSSHRDSPWANWEEEMWKKTVVKQASKLVSRNPRMQSAVVNDDLVESGNLHRHDRAAEFGLLEDTKTAALEEAVSDPVEPVTNTDVESFFNELTECTTPEEVTNAFDSRIRPNRETIGEAAYKRCYQAAKERASSIRGEAPSTEA